MSSAVEQFVSSFSWSALSKAGDLKKRIYFTLGVLLIYRLGTFIPLPGINPMVLQGFAKAHSSGILGILDMFSGGAMGRMTIFALNIMPYISASIIVQLMTSVSPYLEALKKEGETGRRRLNQYTRYGTVGLALVQALGIAVALEKMTHGGLAAVTDPGFLFRLTTMITLTGGTLFIMWLGEQITARGIGQGSSLIICAGILANLPQSVVSTLELGRQGAISFFIIAAILIGVAAVILYIVFMEKAQRRVPIQYPKRQVAPHLPPVSKTSHLPLKLNSSGVIPPIFASSLLLMPTTIMGFSATDPDSILGKITKYFNHGEPVYMLSFVALIIFFSFFYTAIVFNPKETAENLKKSGAYIPGYRPGEKTATYLDYVLTRLTAVGSIYLASLCILPEIILANVHLPFYFGGTSFLITIGVTIDLLNQVQSYMVAHQYEGLVRKSRSKGKL